MTAPQQKTPSSKGPRPAMTAKTRLALAAGLFSLSLLALQINVAAGAVVAAASCVIFAVVILPNDPGTAQQIVGRPLSGFQAGQTRPGLGLLKRFFAPASAPKIR